LTYDTGRSTASLKQPN